MYSLLALIKPIGATLERGLIVRGGLITTNEETFLNGNPDCQIASATMASGARGVRAGTKRGSYVQSAAVDREKLLDECLISWHWIASAERSAMQRQSCDKPASKVSFPCDKTGTPMAPNAAGPARASLARKGPCAECRVVLSTTAV